MQFTVKYLATDYFYAREQSFQNLELACNVAKALSEIKQINRAYVYDENTKSLIAEYVNGKLQ